MCMQAHTYIIKNTKNYDFVFFYSFCILLIKYFIYPFHDFYTKIPDHSTE